MSSTTAEETTSPKPTFRQYMSMFSVALTDFSRNNCPYIAAGIAYWTLFALFPLTLAFISIIGFVLPSVDDQARLIEGIISEIPVSVDYLSELLQGVIQARGALGFIAVFGLIFTSTTVFSAVRKGINHAWHIGKPPYFLLERGTDLAMMAVLVIVSFIGYQLKVISPEISTFSDTIGGVILWGLIIASLETISLFLTIGVFLLMYKYLPNTPSGSPVEWRDVWLGTLFGAIIFFAMSNGFAWFVGNIANFGLVYGSLGALVSVLMWAYLSALAIVWGAQLCYTYSMAFGSRADPDYLPQPKMASDDHDDSPHGILATVRSWIIPPRE